MSKCLSCGCVCGDNEDLICDECLDLPEGQPLPDEDTEIVLDLSGFMDLSDRNREEGWPYGD